MRTVKQLAFAFAFALMASGCAPDPYEPGTDCPKEAYCGQCASRGVCAWCGDPGDSSKGQCVAVGRAECVAPQAWSKTPDHCPAPPASAVSPSLASSASASESASAQEVASAKEAVGPAKFEQIRRTLQRAFPSAEATDQAVAGVVAVLIAQKSRFSRAGVTSSKPQEKAPIERRVREGEHPLYLGHADHHRVKSLPTTARPMQSQFSMALPMVRVRLPDALPAGNAGISTAIGDVYLSRDHLLGSIDLLASKYGGPEYLGYRPERVDLITPARVAGTRFGAIAVYLGYRKKSDKGPSFYMFEAGTATGDARMIYFSPDFKPIKDATSYYLPTPFVSMRNTYSGYVKMRAAPDEDEPEKLYIESRAVGDADPYITVTVSYDRVKEMDVPIPAEIMIDAGARVSLIAKTMGLTHAEDLQNTLAELAKDFAWIEYPRYVTPGAPSASAAPSAGPAPAPPR